MERGADLRKAPYESAIVVAEAHEGSDGRDVVEARKRFGWTLGNDLVTTPGPTGSEAAVNRRV